MIIKYLLTINIFNEFDWKYLSMNNYKEFSFWFYVSISIITSIIYFTLFIYFFYQNSKLKSLKLKSKSIIQKEIQNNPIESNLLSMNDYIENILLYDFNNDNNNDNNNDKNNFNNNENHEELNEKEKEYKNNNNYLNIQRLTKKYNDIIAINDLSIDFFPNEIFCLLGENGAGKTTLINIISGLINPDEGDILYNGISLINNKEYLFKNIGLCNQEDILFENLTVKEHLYYFFKFRGENYNNEKIDIFLKNIKLNEIENKLCKHLSKGEKRKLSIALSLIGNNNIILLDEPTSGLDTNSRKELWKFLKENKKDKIIILTTHSLEEAEFLSDKIGIIKDGKYIYSGTSSFLKNKYQNGFNLNLIINSSFNEETREQLINEFKDINNVININSENLFQIKLNINDEEEIKNIFQIVDNIKKIYNIKKYSISTTSLEDYFIKLNNIEKKEEDNNLNDNNIIKEDFIIPLFPQFYVNLKRKLHELINIIYFTFFIIQIIIILMFKRYDNSIKMNNFNEIENLLKMNNNIDLYTNDINYIKNSKYYKQLNQMNISLNLINNNKYFENISLFQSYINQIYNQDQLLLKKNIVLFERNITNNEIKIYNLYYPNLIDYFQVTMTILINIISEKEFNLTVNSLKGYIDYFPHNIKIISSYNEYYILILFMNILIIQIFIIYNNNKEKKLNLKYFLYLNGINKLSYWLGIFCFDLIIIMIYIFELYIYIKNIIFIFSIFLNLFSFIIFIYFISLLINIHFIFYVIYVVICFTLFLSELNETQINFYRNKINYFLYLTSFLKMIFSFYFKNNRNFYNYYQIFIIKALIYGILLILIEIGLFKKINDCLCKISFYKIETLLSKSIMKNNINIELYKTLLINSKNNCNKQQEEKIKKKDLAIRLINIRKIYFKCCKKNKIALNKINLGLKKNEKFGLLGFNNSGKSTLIKSLINEIEYEGEIFLFQKKLKSNFNELKKNIGYCPQENNIFNDLTVKEILIFYKTLKNIKTNIIELSKKYDLEKYLNIKSGNLSYGNKKKLSFAISIMNNPKLLLLDEPTIGIDSESRKKIYKIIQNINQQNMILITQSIEEAELLCDTISWLNKGEFEFIGNSEELKLMYSIGYIFQLKIKNDNINNINNINSNCNELFNKLKLKI